MATMVVRWFGLVLLVASSSAAAAGCGGIFTDHSTPGALDRVSFGYVCVFGCESVANNAMAAGGAQTTIGVTFLNGGGGSFAAVGSTNPAVASFSLGNPGVHAVSGVAGTTTLQLLDSSNALIDSTTITVADSATLAFPAPWAGAGPVVLVGATTVFHVTTEDAHGNTTIGTGSVQFALSGPIVSTIDPVLGTGDEVAFIGNAVPSPTAATITATAPSATATLNATIVPISDIATLTATEETASPDGNGNETVTVLVTPNSSAGPVYGAPCSWAPSSSAVQIQNQAVNDLGHAPGSLTQLLITKHGASSAVCTIGGATATFNITF